MPRGISAINAIWRERQEAALRAQEATPPGTHTRHGFDPNQPRVPAGNPDGGQWTDTGAAGTDPRVLSDVMPDNDWLPEVQYAGRRGSRSGGPGQMTPGQGARLTIAEAQARDAIRRVREIDPEWKPTPSAHSSGHQSFEDLVRRYEGEVREAEARLREFARFDVPPKVPDERPPTVKEQNRAIREVAAWMARNPSYTLNPSSWLYEHRTLIESYCEPPKTLEQLQRGALMPKRGHDIHHTVEQAPARHDGFSRSVIDGAENRVSVPRLKHWEITGWFGRSNKEYGNLSPREYLRGKDWEERVRVGKKALIEHGVLKP